MKGGMMQGKKIGQKMDYKKIQDIYAFDITKIFCAITAYIYICTMHIYSIM